MNQLQEIRSLATQIYELHRKYVDEGDISFRPFTEEPLDGYNCYVHYDLENIHADPFYWSVNVSKKGRKWYENGEGEINIDSTDGYWFIIIFYLFLLNLELLPWKLQILQSVLLFDLHRLELEQVSNGMYY